MSDHNSAVFNNSCLKIPRNPVSNQPFPVYEQKYLNQLKNQATKLRLQTNECSMKSKKSLDSDRSTIKSLMEFYDSIPEYDDVNHLPSKEFYRRLENLKEKQKLYCERLQTEIKLENKDTEWIEDYKNLSSGEKKTAKNKRTKNSPLPLKNNIEDVDFLDFSDREPITKPPSRRSVRIESPSDKCSLEATSLQDLQYRPKSRANLSSAGSGFKGFQRSATPYGSAWDDLSIEDLKLDLDKDLHLETKSAPNSPSRSKTTVGWKDTITIPQPFQMTVRDEENKIVEELLIKTKKPKEEKPEMFKAHPVPIESQIPLFDKIMSDQEKRSNYVKTKRKAELMANMQPFSFTRREEELNALTKRLSKSSPSVFLDDPPIKVKHFTAKPVPRNLFSNYIYKKMHEDEFYRALQKKIRAEEMLKASSLPPSMAKRERSKPKQNLCPRTYRDLDTEDGLHVLKKISDRSKEERDDEELEDLKNEYLCRSYYKSLKGKSGRRKRGKQRFYSAGSRTSENTKSPSSIDLSSINTSNLAAVLRMQSARKRLEMEMVKKLEEAKLKEEARWREKVMRKKPVWQSLAYSQEEDLAMRLQLRRDEERLRNEEHKERMQLMLGRVSQQPTLFERQSQYNHPKDRQEYLCKLYNSYVQSGSPNLSVSDSSGKRSVVEMKDEAVQAFLEAEMKKYEKDNARKTANEEEEKEKCEIPSEVNTESDDDE